MMKQFCGCFRINYEKAITRRKLITEELTKVIEEYKINIISNEIDKIDTLEVTTLEILSQIDHDKGTACSTTREKQNSILVWLNTGEPVVLIFSKLEAVIVDILLNGKPKLEVHRCMNAEEFPTPDNLDSGNLNPFNDILYVDVDTFKGEY